MTEDFRGSYRPARDESAAEPSSWIEAVATALRRLDPAETARSCHLVIEDIVVLADQDTLQVTVLDTLTRSHRTVERRDIDIYRRGFDPVLTSLDAAKLICLELQTTQS
jgi:hypothetical protein